MVLELLKTLNSLSPLAVIALLGLVLFYQSKNIGKSETSFTTLTDNHLHNLPLIVENMEKILVSLQRMEVANATAFGTILANLSGNRDQNRGNR